MARLSPAPILRQAQQRPISSPIKKQSIAQLKAQGVPPLRSLIRRTAHTRERITITDHGKVTDHGQAAAVLINPRELTDLQVDLTLALCRAQQASGTATGVHHEELRRRLACQPVTCELSDLRAL